MVNTKLIKLLKSFSKTEIKQFGSFVISPFFNKNTHVIKLYEIISDYYPQFDFNNLTEEKIYSDVFGNEAFDYYKIKNIISDLFQLALKFLKYIAAEKKNLENEIILLNELHERKLDIFYDQREKLIKRELNNRLIKDEYYYQTLHQLARVNTSHYKFEKSGYTFNLIQNEFDVFLRYSLTSLLRHYSKMLTNKNHGNINFNLEMFEYLWDYVKDKEFEDNPSCRIYKQIIVLELSKNEKDYRALIETKEKYIKNLSEEELYYILLVANSFAVYRLKQGDESFYNDRFLIFKEMVERNFSMTDYILFVNFISSFTSACMVGEYLWAENFLVKFQNGISPPEERLNSVNYCKAFLAYRLREFDKALNYFSKTNFKLFLTKVMVKSLSLRIYYEQNMHEQTFSAIDAFRHYLKSEKLISEEQKSAHYEFLKHITELTKLKLKNLKNNKDVNLSMLRKQINKMSSNPLGTKNWLIDKAKNLLIDSQKT